MTIISIILPFVLFGPAIERLPGVGFKDEFNEDLNAMSSVLLTANTVIHSNRLTNMDDPGGASDDFGQLSASITFDIASTTVINSTTALRDGVHTTRTHCDTAVELTATTSTDLPGEVQNATARASFKISTIGNVNSTVTYADGGKTRRRVVSVEVSKISGSTMQAGSPDMREKTTTFSAVVGSDTETEIETTTLNAELEDTETVVHASTKAEYSDLSVDWSDPDHPSMYTGTHTLVEFSTTAAADSKLSEGGDLVFVNFKANIMEVSSSTANKLSLARGVGEKTKANTTRSATMRVDTAIATSRKYTGLPSAFRSAAHSHLSRQSVDDFHSAKTVAEQPAVETRSKTTTRDECSSEYSARGELDHVAGAVAPPPLPKPRPPPQQKHPRPPPPQKHLRPPPPQKHPRPPPLQTDPPSPPPQSQPPPPQSQPPPPQSQPPPAQQQPEQPPEPQPQGPQEPLEPKPLEPLPAQPSEPEPLQP